jgi:hypothetical protein
MTAATPVPIVPTERLSREEAWGVFRAIDALEHNAHHDAASILREDLRHNGWTRAYPVLSHSDAKTRGYGISRFPGVIRLTPTPDGLH